MLRKIKELLLGLSHGDISWFPRESLGLSPSFLITVCSPSRKLNPRCYALAITSPPRAVVLFKKLS